MNLTVETAPATHAIESRPIVANLEGVSKNYGPVRALRAVDFNVCAGELVALLGPNGAGKTTTVKLLLGLMPPHAGKVRVFGGDPPNPENRKRTGAMLQVGRVPETLRVREHIDLFSSYYRKPMPLRGMGRRVKTARCAQSLLPASAPSYSPTPFSEYCARFRNGLAHQVR